jgi:hypothetical protein
MYNRCTIALHCCVDTCVHKQNIENCPFEFQGPLGKNAHAHTPAGPAQRRLPREALTNNLHTLRVPDNDTGPVRRKHTHIITQSK